MLRRLPALLPVLAIGAAACSWPPAAEVGGSDATVAGPPPRLAETAQFDAALARAGPDAERLGADADTLAARAEALRARAEALAAPVLAPGERDRLDAAGP
jgi:hypothetical protein